jgi:uncharacterized phosphosugar-binding protein
MLDCLESIDADMPRTTASADAAAALFVRSDYSICPWGDPAFVEEFTGRAGGLMAVSRIRPAERQVAKAIILVAPRQDRVESDIRQAARMKREDNLLVLFAGPVAKAAMQKTGAHFDFVIDTHASEHGGLVEAGGRWVLPTDRAASIAALWTWTGEFVGACTRLGKMPVMWQSLSVPGAEKRAAKFRTLKFHDIRPAPMKPGLLGRGYLNALSRKLQSMRASEEKAIAAVVEKVEAATAKGRTFYVCGAGHATKHAPDQAADPGLFTFLTEGGAGIIFQPGDFLLCNGYDAHWLEAQLGPVSRECRRLGGTVAWSLTTYGGKPVQGIEPGEVVIDQRWELGDALVAVPGYDVRILPASGVIAEAVLWTVAEEIMRRR